MVDARGLYLQWRETSISVIARRVGSTSAVFSPRSAFETEQACVPQEICLRGSALAKVSDWAFLFGESCPLMQLNAEFKNVSGKNIYICLDAALFFTFNNHLFSLLKKFFPPVVAPQSSLRPSYHPRALSYISSDHSTEWQSTTAAAHLSFS